MKRIKQFFSAIMKKSNPRVGYFFLSVMEIAFGSWLMLPLTISIMDGSLIPNDYLVTIFFGANLVLLGGITLYSIVKHTPTLRNKASIFHVVLWSFLSAYALIGETISHHPDVFHNVFAFALVSTFISIMYHLKLHTVKEGR